MKKVLQNSKLLRVIERLFADDSQRVTLEPEQVLMREGEFNDKLYLVRSGELKGYVFNPDGSRYELFNASRKLLKMADSQYNTPEEQAAINPVQQPL